MTNHDITLETAPEPVAPSAEATESEWLAKIADIKARYPG